MRVLWKLRQVWNKTEALENEAHHLAIRAFFVIYFFWDKSAFKRSISIKAACFS